MNQQNLTHASRKPLSVEIGGVAHLGRYQTEKRMIRVSTQLGGLSRSPAMLARLILSELVREHHG
jgi:hypothetical protein